MISKYVQVEFANTYNHRAVDAIIDICAAAEHAAFNLLSKYEVRLETPKVINNYQVVIEVQIPESIAESFSVGPHLRGISTYLLRYCKGKYDDAVVGKRLLDYTIIPAPDLSPEKFPVADRFRAISDLARLMENNDDESLKKIGRIIKILKS